jgi:site-specific DNA-methyltransferase (adenine-specific)
VSAEVRLGRWQDVLADVAPHAVIVDPPYGQRTHEWSRIVNDRQEDDCDRSPIDYAHWTPADVDGFVRSWAARTSCWIVAMTSHDLVPHWMDSYDGAGWYSFPPIAAVISGMSVRMGADGPASWTIHICVARRKAKRLGAGSSVWRSLPGGYTGPAASTMSGGRGKPAWLLDALVRDYSDPGMTIVDPCAGWGSTLVAARNAGRNAIGAEMDPAAFERCQHALSGDMAAYARAAPRRERETDPDRPGLFDAIGGAR